MKSFNKWLEQRKINEGIDALKLGGEGNLASRLGKIAVNTATNATMSLVGGEGGPDVNAVQAVVGGVGDAISQLKKSWRQRRGVDWARQETAKKSVTPKGQRRHPDLVQKLVDSQNDLDEEFLKHLSKAEQDQVEKNLVQAINNGSVTDHHANRFAASIIKKKAEDMMALVRKVESLPNLRLATIK